MCAYLSKEREGISKRKDSRACIGGPECTNQCHGRLGLTSLGLAGSSSWFFLPFEKQKSFLFSTTNTTCHVCFTTTAPFPFIRFEIHIQAGSLSRRNRGWTSSHPWHCQSSDSTQRHLIDKKKHTYFKGGIYMIQGREEEGERKKRKEVV